MNLKVANLVAIQFGIFIGMMSWLIYSRLPSAELRTAAEMHERRVTPFATVSPAFERRNQRPSTVDYETDHERAQPVDEEAAPTAQDYDQEIATQPYTSPGLGSGYVAADSPSYAQVDQEPAAAPSDYLASPQTIAYAQPTQIVVYPQTTQIVLFSNRRSFGNRFRSSPHSGAPMTTEHRRPDSGQLHFDEGGVVPRANPNAPSCRPTQRFRPRGNR